MVSSHLRACLAAHLALCHLLAPTALCAQRDQGERINAYVGLEMERRQIPGLALLVLRDQRPIFAANYGLADLSLRTPVTESTSFQIASMTKQFTDAAILLLADRGKLAVTDRLSKYLSDLPPAWQAITIQQLMNHTAGLRDDWDENDHFFTSQTTSAEFFESLKAAPLKFAPGTDWSYSCGPFVLGLVIERITGIPYAAFMRQAIFEPLGMTSTDVNDPAVRKPSQAAGYVVRDAVLQGGVHISSAAWARADVGIRTNVNDLARWNAALDDGSLLSAASRRLMFSPGRLSTGEVIAHGLGWYVTPFRGNTEIMHGGAFRTGFNSVIARYPDDRLTIIILTNQFKARSSELAREIASFYNAAYRPIRSMQLRPDTNLFRTSVASRILDRLKGGNSAQELLPGVGRLGGWSRAELREELAQASPPSFIDCQDLTGKNVKAFGTPIVANCFYSTAGDKPRYWTFSFTASGRVAYVELEE